MMSPGRTAAIALISICAAHLAWAADTLTISLPRRSELTPVQRLNREGVEAIKRQRVDRAAALFYKAYLYDPADPFTLNNLGYISELQGESDLAHKFYTLASEQGCDANIDRSSVKQLEGKPMDSAYNSLQDLPMRINRMNVSAMDLLSRNRGFQAASLLREALTLDPRNPFTLNNLGVADESVGDFDSALTAYLSAAQVNSKEQIVVAQDRAWRGRPVSQMAEASAVRLTARMKKMDVSAVHAAMLAQRGVSATNENDWGAARQDFLNAYTLDPGSAFSLNNRGYVAEKDGDLETAQFYYGKARKAADSGLRVGLATLGSAEGRKLSSVATDSNRQVDGALDRYSQERRLETAPAELIPRNGALIGDLTTPTEMALPTDNPPLEASGAPQTR
jgi:Flp pilus assembly protein TadD